MDVTIYLFIYLSIDVTIYLFIYLCAYLPTYPKVPKCTEKSKYEKALDYVVEARYFALKAGNKYTVIETEALYEQLKGDLSYLFYYLFYQSILSIYYIRLYLNLSTSIPIYINLNIYISISISLYLYIKIKHIELKGIVS